MGQQSSTSISDKVFNKIKVKEATILLILWLFTGQNIHNLEICLKIIFYIKFATGQKLELKLVLKT